jgi:hypothetical protein
MSLSSSEFLSSFEDQLNSLNATIQFIEERKEGCDSGDTIELKEKMEKLKVEGILNSIFAFTFSIHHVFAGFLQPQSPTSPSLR